MSLRNTRRKVPVRAVSSAVTQTSPSPCTPCPSPAEDSAPAVQTGRYKVVPATSSFKSMLPPNSRGTIEVHSAIDWRRRHPHHPEERRQFDLGPPRQGRHAALAVDPGMPGFADREILRQGPGERPDAGIAPVLPGIDRQDLDFEDIAGLGPLDSDRPGQDVCTEARLQRLMDR